MKNIVIIILLAFLASCTTQKKCNRMFPPQIKDSIVKETVVEVKDTTITLPPDSSWLKALIDCDDAGEAYLATIEEMKSGNNVKPIIRFKDKYLYVECKVDSQKVYLHWKQKYSKETNTTTVTPAAIVTNELTQWQVFQMWLGRILLIVVVVYFGYKFIRNKFKIF